MSAEKRDFENFDKFPGEVSAVGIYEFPRLVYKDDAGRERFWQVFIRLVRDGNRQTTIDWELGKEKQVKIAEKYFGIKTEYYDLPDGVIAEQWVETGLSSGKTTRTIPTYHDSVKFAGQTNQRNLFQNALIDARALFIKKRDTTGSVKKKSSTNVMYFPMLAKPYKDGAKYLKYPLWVQPKLDGVRCLCYIPEKDCGDDAVIFYTRLQHEYPAMGYLAKLLYPYLNDLYDTDANQSIYLDGEMYVHGRSLQEITGVSKNEARRAETDHNEYHIYDCFYPGELDIEFTDRHKQLDNLFHALDNETAALVKAVPTTWAKDEAAVAAIYKQYIAAHFEGVILRNAAGPYKANATKTGSFMRSKDLVKMKNKSTDEFKIVGYTEGKKGKDVGAVIWIAETDKGRRFNVTPKDTTYAERYKLFKQCENNFDKLFAGRMMTLEYESLSDKGVPLRAKALIFRDYE